MWPEANGASRQGLLPGGFYANVLHYCSEQGRARQHIKLAMRYSPFQSTLFKDILAETYRATGYLDQAARAAHESIASDPNYLIAPLILASLAVKLDKPDNSTFIAQKISLLEPTFSIARFAAGQPYRSKELLKELVTELCDAYLPECPQRVQAV